MDEDIRDVEGIDRVQVGLGDDGIKLYLDRHDGSGVAVELDQEQFIGLEDVFMLTDKNNETGEVDSCE